MDVKMNFRIITKNHAADSKIGSSQKIDFRADGTHESHPIAWELIWLVDLGAGAIRGHALQKEVKIQF